MADIRGQRVVVLGGMSGIGLAVAHAAAAEGAAIAIASSRRDRVDAALATLPPESVGHSVDFARADAVEAFFEAIGPYDHLVYTAGESLMIGAIAETNLEAAQRFFQVRYWGAYAAAKFGHRSIRSGGSIVFTSGTAGRRPRAGWSLGASICSAMEGLTRALAVELAPIRVNLVIPGLVKTDLWSGMTEAARNGMYAAAAAHLPVGHMGEAHEVAQAYLAFMRQTYATGQSVVIDGGGMLA